MPVAQKTPNQLGLYDMSGNVWEWCFTAYESNRVFRGGCWAGNASELQVGGWYEFGPSGEVDGIGFRFAGTQ